MRKAKIESLHQTGVIDARYRDSATDEELIKHHTTVTLEVCIEELEAIREKIGSLSPSSWQIVQDRIKELRDQLKQ